MFDDLKPIQNQIEELFKAAKAVLEENFPNLYFYLSPEGYISCWVKTLKGGDGAGINLKQKLNINQLGYSELRYLQELNGLIEPVHKDPKNYFYCTECGKVKPVTEFAENVFAGYYCKDCAKIPSVAKLIEDSHKRGFYD